jgi:hypothetical protein
MSDAATPYRKDRRSTGTDINPGPYIAVVKDNTDPTKMGNLRVLIPSLSGADTGNSGNLFTVKYLSPFYGVTSPDALSAAGGAYDYESTQHSYGMWMVPPDIDTRVMVIFVEGKKSQGYWFGCIQEPYMNHMIPGLAASRNTETETPGDKKKIYGSDYVPAGEPNRELFASASGAEGIDNLPKPIHPFANRLRNQGLSQDTVRGTTTSSARRESPSSVFGISTPGRPNNRDPNKGQLGTSDNIQNVTVVKDAGHTFVMDDGDTNGDNQLIRLRTSSGHQLLMHDTKGVVYLANGSGNVWMEFAADGTVDIYSKLGYNLRSGGDINFHSEGDINMYANRNIKIKANQHLGEDPYDRTIKGFISIDGSVINQIASRHVNVTAEQGNYNLRTGMSIYSQAAGGQQIHQAAGQVHLVGSQVHFNSIPADPNLLQPLKRTGFNQPHGTGTAEIQVPDVTPVLTSGTGVLQVDTQILGMTGMRVPTHEPWTWHSDKFVKFPTGGNIEDSERPGTLGYVSQQNRLNENPVIRLGQYEADLTDYIKKTVPSTTDIASIQQATDTFTKNYSLTYGLPTTAGFSINPLQGGVSDVSQRLIRNITGQSNNTSDLFKNQILVNQGGILYTVGNLDKSISSLGNNFVGQLSANVKNYATTTVGSIINREITSTARNVADQIFGSAGDAVYTDYGSEVISTFADGMVPGLGNSYFSDSINIATDSYANIIGGEYTSFTDITSVLSGGFENPVGIMAESVASFFGGFGW